MQKVQNHTGDDERKREQRQEPDSPEQGMPHHQSSILLTLAATT